VGLKGGDTVEEGGSKKKKQQTGRTDESLRLELGEVKKKGVFSCNILQRRGTLMRQFLTWVRKLRDRVLSNSDLLLTEVTKAVTG